ncbi:peptide/nickel transport system ATP-binding protein [Arthrobacter sp. V4I6]|uniref:nickel ABC transporter ATP-binding protein NikE n=1 Tax=unclassified Arthrobacter TaxID=235627 RepID=UPI002780BDAC|nr:MULTISPECIES: ABC transporter ATP-binding protein [unclassified Arthrobacter]MDQ0819901.1 peptide/nickel transport system ATP-binding protein [Arthrobacter sp. V1I7]MDQ0854082.1 peptide/nickel transport system ATP-binding protein [Arthrobacter sp. V4I6]
MSEGLIIEGLRVGQRARPGGRPTSFRQGPAKAILSDLDLSVTPGEFVALVGTSGSGKTMTALSVMGLLPPGVHIENGSVRFGGTDLRALGEAELNRVRGGRIGMLYQQPKRMFNPRKTIANHLAEPLKLHRGLRGSSARTEALELLAEAGFEDPAWCARAYPHQLSGGMAQRAMFALAMAGQPELLLADEPTSALDKVLERQILELIDRQRRARGLGVLYITHDLATVSAFADRVVVLEAGRVQESGPVRRVLCTPRTTYTKELLSASALPPAPAPAAAPSRPILGLRNVTKRFPSNRRGARPAVDDVSLELREGEILGILGQSGSGKSTLARLILGLETPDSGSITRFLGAAVNRAGAPGKDFQLVFQEPHDVFDPRMKLRTSLEAPLRPRRDCTAEDRSARIHRVVREVDLDPALLDRYPGQCSGGQLQRLTIARALLLEPAVLICDEATSALDAVTQRTVLDLLLRLHRDRQLSLIMISHDMNVLRYMSHRVAVLFQGAVVEVAPNAEFFAAPRHGHSKQLVAAALPVPTPATGGQRSELLDAV